MIIFTSGVAHSFYYVSISRVLGADATIKSPDNLNPAPLAREGEAQWGGEGSPEAKHNVPFLSHLSVEVSVQSGVTA